MFEIPSSAVANKNLDSKLKEKKIDIKNLMNQSKIKRMNNSKISSYVARDPSSTTQKRTSNLLSPGDQLLQ
jgi:hypothetical protein